MTDINEANRSVETNSTKSNNHLRKPFLSDSNKFKELISTVGSKYPIINKRTQEDDVLIQNSGRKESYWVPNGAAADAATAAALGRSIKEAPSKNIITEAKSAVEDFTSNYQNMRNANTIGADKYFHCKANCEATQRGKTGEFVAETISDGREWVDMNIKGDSKSASDADQKANHHGRKEGEKNSDKSCVDICAPFRPNGLNPKY